MIKRLINYKTTYNQPITSIALTKIIHHNFPTCKNLINSDDLLIFYILRIEWLKIFRSDYQKFIINAIN